MPAKDAQVYAAALFEKAQGGIATLAQIDAQVGELLAQRRTVQSELTSVQSQINDEFGRLMRESDELPARVLAEISGGRGTQSAVPEAARRSNVAEPVA